MNKGESVISIVLAVIVLAVILAIKQQWRPASLERVTTKAENFVLTTTGLGDKVPPIPGYELVSDYTLVPFRAALYRASPSTHVFASYRFVLYDRQQRVALQMESLEEARQPWTRLYNFAGRNGAEPVSRRTRAAYMRDLTGNGMPDIIIGQYSGGDHCCSTATVVELGKDAARVMGRIDGMDGLPFEGMELRHLDNSKAWQVIAHRPYQTVCGLHADAADVLSIYAVTNGTYSDQTFTFQRYLDDVLRQDIARWSRPPQRSLHLLQTIATDYVRAGQLDEGKRFFALNLPQFMAQLQANGVDPNDCEEDVSGLLASLAPKDQQHLF